MIDCVDQTSDPNSATAQWVCERDVLLQIKQRLLTHVIYEVSERVEIEDSSEH